MAFCYFLLLTVLLLEMLALVIPTKLLKITATSVSLYSLIFFVLNKPDGTFMTVWPLGMNIYGLTAKCINFLWLRDPAELVRVSGSTSTDDGAKNADAGKVKSPIRHSVSRVMDAFEIAVTFRGVGWYVLVYYPLYCRLLLTNSRAFEAKGIPDPPPACRSRVRFILEQIVGILWRFLFLDIGITCANMSLGTLDNSSFPLRLGFGAFMMLYVRWTMDIPYRVVACINVAGGWSRPSDWPPLFGFWKDAWTIRRFWSHTWHQSMRLHAEPPVNFVVHNILGIRKGTYLSNYGKIFGNFIVAYALHAYGRILAGGNHMNDWNMFMAQFIAIWVDETIRDIAIASGLVSKDWAGARWVGYMWTAVFETWTFLYFMEGAIRLHGLVPVEGLIEPVFGASVAQPMLRWYKSRS